MGPRFHGLDAVVLPNCATVEWSSPRRGPAAWLDQCLTDGLVDGGISVAAMILVRFTERGRPTDPSHQHPAV